MMAKGIIQNFIVMVNPAIFAYEKQCFLTARNIDKIVTKEEGYVFNQLNLLGDIRVYARQLGGDGIFVPLIRPEAEEKIKLINFRRSCSTLWEVSTLRWTRCAGDLVCC
jgi:hypothetical protein